MKKILILFVLITASIGLHAQQNEIIFVDFEPDSVLHVGNHLYPNEMRIDIDNDNLYDIRVYWALESPGVAVTLTSRDSSVKMYQAEEGDTISNLTGWWTGTSYPHLHENYAVRIEKDGNYYYGWFRTYTVFVPSVTNDFCFDKYAFCTIPDYPLVWGQTDIWGIEETLPTTIAHIYPNPAKEQLHFEFSPDMQPALVVFYDLQGRLVHTQHSAFESIDMSQLPAGTYMMRVIMVDGKRYSDKVVKE